MADGFGDLKDTKKSSTPPLLNPVQFIKQYEQTHPPNIQLSKAVRSEDTKPFFAGKIGQSDVNVVCNRKKRQRTDSAESVFEDPWQELGGGTTASEAYSKIPGLFSTLGDLILREKEKSQRVGRGRFQKGLSGRTRENGRRRSHGRGRGRGRGRGNNIKRENFPMSFSGRY